jgi:hypothetical protein
LEQAVMRMHSHWHWSLLPAGVASNRLAGPALLFCCDAIPMAWRPIYGKPPWHQQLRRGLGYRQAVAGMAGACLFQWGWRVHLGCQVMDSSTLFLPHFSCYKGPFRTNYTHSCGSTAANPELYGGFCIWRLAGSRSQLYRRRLHRVVGCWKPWGVEAEPAGQEIDCWSVARQDFGGSWMGFLPLEYVQPWELMVITKACLRAF